MKKKMFTMLALITLIFSAIPSIKASAGTWYSETDHLGQTRWTYWNSGINQVTKGWVYDNGNWYYIDCGYMYDPGKIDVGYKELSPWTTIKRNDGSNIYSWYLFNPGGTLVQKEGWDTGANGRWIYWIPGIYGLATGEWMNINGESFYFNDDGYCTRGRGC
ncbi:hypothetical protein [Bacillus pseudomycoides]|uniref:hypothetical protein n=1 Tax=Bacillus pseudomycoides TaxID=64104 RepID=UPI0020D1FE55|nr:hypothetical protein [Bacillus pseudomycoides]